MCEWLIVKVLSRANGCVCEKKKRDFHKLLSPVSTISLPAASSTKAFCMRWLPVKSIRFPTPIPPPADDDVDDSKVDGMRVNTSE